MIFLFELFLFVYGIIALVKKEWSIGGGRKVLGGHAQVLGLISVLVLPVVLALGVGFGVFWGLTQGTADFPQIPVTIAEVVIVLGIAVTLGILGKKFYAKQEALRAQQAATQAQAPQDPLPPAQ